MTKQILAACVAIAALSTPLHAELTYTMAIDAHKSATAPAPAANPAVGAFGSLVLATLAPEGGLTATVTVGPRGTRVEYKGMPLLPEGAVSIVKPDGSMVVLDPAAKTYWTTTSAALGAPLSPVHAKTTLKRTGTYATIAGVRAERVTFEIHVPVPARGDAPAASTRPAEIVLTGEAWIAPQYKQYATMTTRLGGLGSIGLGDLASQGFMMRSILRGDLFAGEEVESRVTSISEAPAPAGAFDVPAGYHEEPAPASFASALPPAH